jgi:hypothetical protein
MRENEESFRAEARLNLRYVRALLPAEAKAGLFDWSDCAKNEQLRGVVLSRVYSFALDSILEKRYPTLRLRVRAVPGI